MTDLVQVPWQPECWLTPDTLALLEAASDHAGTHLVINGADGAWRSYARQKYLYDGYVEGRPGFNTASNPDTGQRNHMRGAAFDLIRTDAAAQAACRAVGLVRDADEPWHWNNPRWASMPIIPTNASSSSTTASTIATPLTPTQKGFLMALTDDEQEQLKNDVAIIRDFLVDGKGQSVQSGKVGRDFAPQSVLGRIDTLQDYVYRGNGQSVQSGIAGRDFGAKSILGRIAAAFKP